MGKGTLFVASTKVNNPETNIDTDQACEGMHTLNCLVGNDASEGNYPSEYT